MLMIGKVISGGQAGADRGVRSRASASLREDTHTATSITNMCF